MRLLNKLSKILHKFASLIFFRNRCCRGFFLEFGKSISNFKYYLAPTKEFHQEHSCADVLQNKGSKKFRKFHQETPVLETPFNKVAGLTLFKVYSSTGVFLWNLRNLLRTSGGCFWFLGNLQSFRGVFCVSYVVSTSYLLMFYVLFKRT